jgi:hypothetical protein
LVLTRHDREREGARVRGELIGGEFHLDHAASGARLWRSDDEPRGVISGRVTTTGDPAGAPVELPLVGFTAAATPHLRRCHQAGVPLVFDVGPDFSSERAR